MLHSSFLHLAKEGLSHAQAGVINLRNNGPAERFLLLTKGLSTRQEKKGISGMTDGDGTVSASATPYFNYYCSFEREEMHRSRSHPAFMAPSTCVSNGRLINHWRPLLRKGAFNGRVVTSKRRDNANMPGICCVGEPLARFER